jgi:hypothetical protein
LLKSQIKSRRAVRRKAQATTGMSKFVNYKKRSVTLPPGCKNLSDLLETHGHTGAVSPDKPPVVSHNEFAGGISDIEKYVVMVFESSASNLADLTMTPPEQQFTINVTRMMSEMSANVHVQAGTNQERAVRSFFAHRGLVIPLDSEVIPPQFHPDLPWETVFNILPLPSEAPLLTKLVADLLREVLGVRDGFSLSFQYSEVRDAV